MTKYTCAPITLMLPSFVTVSAFPLQMCLYNDAYFTAASECEVNNAGCDHFCNETLYSYTCSCYPGYTLHTDGYTCIGLVLKFLSQVYIA